MTQTLARSSRKPTACPCPTSTTAARSSTPAQCSSPVWLWGVWIRGTLVACRQRASWLVPYPCLLGGERMTRAERLAKAEALAREQLERQRLRLAKVQARQREEERKALVKRRVLVGQMVLDTPLASLDDQTLQGLFQVLAALV